MVKDRLGWGISRVYEKPLFSQSWFVFSVTVFVRVTIAVIETMTKSKLGRKGFISHTVPYNSSSKAARAGTQAGQDPGRLELMQRP